MSWSGTRSLSVNEWISTLQYSGLEYLAGRLFEKWNIGGNMEQLRWILLYSSMKGKWNSDKEQRSIVGTTKARMPSFISVKQLSFRVRWEISFLNMHHPRKQDGTNKTFRAKKWSKLKDWLTVEQKRREKERYPCQESPDGSLNWVFSLSELSFNPRSCLSFQSTMLQSTPRFKKRRTNGTWSYKHKNQDEDNVCTEIENTKTCGNQSWNGCTLVLPKCPRDILNCQTET